jgi:sodium/bile acid cotransporter 7
MMVLPLMNFHQRQLMTCAVLAKRYQKQQQARVKGALGTPRKP